MLEFEILFSITVILVLFRREKSYCINLDFYSKSEFLILIEILFAFAGVQPDGKSGYPAILSKRTRPEWHVH